VIVSGLAALVFILLFNDTTSAYLFGAWMLIGLVAWHYFFAVAGTSYKSLILVSVVSALALLLLPVGVNRITLKLPSLSGQTHFSLHQEIDDAPVASAHYYQRIVEYEELEIHLASQYYPMQADNAPWLQIRDDQEGVIFVIQDVIYEHVLGLFILSLHKIDETGMDSLVLDPASDPVTFFYPNNGGTRIEDLKIGGRAWIKLPAIPDDTIGAREIAIVLVVRLLFWLLICLTIIGWRPVRMQARPSS
jgi:hypothetical protein